MKRGGMLETEADGVPVLQFENLRCEAGLRHAVFTRHGGVSQSPYAALNVARGVGDDPAAVDENRRRIQRRMGDGRLQFARQVHGRRVAVVGNGTRAESPQADALVTATTGALLVIQVADCQAVILYDRVRRVTANIHSGWRGSTVNAVGAAVRTLVERFGCRPADLLAGIGPSLGPCCAEFVHYRQELPPDFRRFKKPGDRFDFWEITRRQLQAVGLLEAHIETAGLCTRCNSERFFSYRARKRTGRFAVVVGMC